MLKFSLKQKPPFFQFELLGTALSLFFIVPPTCKLPGKVLCSIEDLAMKALKSQSDRFTLI